MAAIRKRIDSICAEASENVQVALHGELLALIADLADRHAAKPELARDLLHALRNARAFDRLHVAATDMAARGLVCPFSNRMKVQALVELERYDEALREIHQARTAYPEDKGEQVELAGLEGRIFKQRFVASVAANAPDAAALRSSMTAYMKGWSLSDGHQAWLGVNLAALWHRARSDRFIEGADSDLEALAKQVLAAAVREKEADPKDPWPDASLGEAALALGDYEFALASYRAFASRDAVDAFAVASAHRQLTEIWQIHEQPVNDHVQHLYDQITGLLMRLPNGRIDFGGRDLSGVARRLSDAQEDDGYEGLWGSRPVPLQWAKRMIEIGNCVGRIERRGGMGEAAGTGFVIRADLLSPEWSGYGQVLVTNEHVVGRRDDATLTPEQTAVRFSQVDPQEQMSVGPVLWCSDREHHDVTIFRMDHLPDSVGKFGEIAPLSSLSDGAGGNFSGVTVIGHPAGSERLHLGVENLQVEEMERDRPAGEPERVWYRCPTMKGNSGSPALSWRQLEATAVHHREIKARGCNEGISLDSIQKAIAQRPEGWNRSTNAE